MHAPITIVDYGMGNLHTVRRRLTRLGVASRVTSEARDVAGAEKLVLPGVGHFRQAMENLETLGLLPALHEAALERAIPVLGICLGMQLLAGRSEEGDAAGLGWLDADVVRFRMDDPRRHKVPHIGWNGVTPRKESPLLAGLRGDAEFYFVHAYHVVAHDAADVLCDTEYGYRFTSAVQRGNLFGVQFHPEKSHDAGDQLLKNFAAL